MSLATLTKTVWGIFYNANRSLHPGPLPFQNWHSICFYKSQCRFHQSQGEFRLITVGPDSTFNNSFGTQAEVASVGGYCAKDEIGNRQFHHRNFHCKPCFLKAL